MNLTSAGQVPTKFRWKDADAYLFDIDGTMLVTRDLTHWNALNRAMLEVYGADTTIEGIAYHGKTDVGILRAALERTGIFQMIIDELMPQALKVMAREVATHANEIVAEVCPSIPELLSSLRDSNKLLGVASGNLASVGWQKLKAAGLREFFSFGCYCDSTEMRSDIFRAAVAEVQQRLGQQAKACFVGDTPEDIKAAKLASTPIIAVGTGIFSSDELTSHSPELCIGCCTDLFSL